MTNDTSTMAVVRCPNHHRKLTDGLWNILRAKDYLDSELKCGERSVRAHEILLRVFFSTDITAVQTDLDSENRLKSTGDNLLELVLEFMYKGTVTLSRGKLDDLQATGKKLNFQLLVDAVEETKRCKPATMEISRVVDVPAETLKGHKRSVNRQPRKKDNGKVESAPKRARIRNDTKVDYEFAGDCYGGRSESSSCGPDDEGKKSSFTAKRKRQVTMWVATKRWAPVNDVTETIGILELSSGSVCIHQDDQHYGNTNLYRCWKCRAMFGTDGEIVHHIKEYHWKELGWDNRDFDTRPTASKEVHRSERHQLSPFKCRFCTGYFKTEDARDQHVADHPLLKCTECCYETKSRNDIITHTAYTHGVDNDGNRHPALMCSTCDYVTYIPASFGQHFRENHPDIEEQLPLTEFRCDRCDFKTQRMSIFGAHVTTHVPKIPEPYTCQFCHEKFSSIKARDEHVTKARYKRLANHQPLKCTVCDYRAVRTRTLIRHYQFAHYIDDNGSPIRFLKCSECDFSTTARDYYMRHKIKAHPGNLSAHQDQGLKSEQSAVSEKVNRPKQIHRPPLCCKICNCSFETEDDRSKHLAEHPFLKCTKCSYETRNRKALIMHNSYVHWIDDGGNPLSSLKCSACDYIDSTPVGFRHHVRIKHPGLEYMKPLRSEFRCDRCDFETRMMSLFKSHMASHFPKRSKPYICKFCRSTFSSVKVRDEHVANHNLLKCAVCEYEAMRTKTMIRHYQSAHSMDSAGNPIDVLKCSECKYSTTVREYYLRHKIKAHPELKPGIDGSSIQICQLCNRVLQSVDLLEEHLIDHETYKCNLCDYETKRKRQLYSHRIIAHAVYVSGKPMPIINCSHCKFTCYKPSVLKRHKLANHTSLKPYKCPYCAFATAYKTQVNRHINRVHLNIKNHACKICDFRTTHSSLLEQHMNIHLGHKPYQCDSCEAAFATMKQRGSHQQKHSDAPRRHICHKCGKAFKTACHLKTHMRGVHRKDKEEI